MLFGIFKNFHRDVGLVFVAMLSLVIAVSSAIASQGAETITLRQAKLISLAGERSVALPHVLGLADFDAKGSIVRYRMHFDLPRISNDQLPIGIYVPKMSLAGRLHLNGERIADCELGPVEALRCLHRPYLFVPPSTHWRTQDNVLEFDVYATSRQMNGLSRVIIGPAEELNRDYLLRRALQVSVVNGLAWVALSLGFVVLSVSIALRGDHLYSWFGLTAFAIALGNLNHTVAVIPTQPELFNWFVFSIKQITAPLLMLTILAFFRREWSVVKCGLVFFVIASPAAIWFSGNNRDVVALIYLPLMFFAPILACLSLFWSWKSRRMVDFWMAASFTTVVASSIFDWFRLTGNAAFEGVYLVTYVIPSVVVVMGTILAGQLAAALRTARELTSELDRRVEERTEALTKANRQLEELSATDGLTTLTNRRYFDKILNKEWLRARRNSQPLTLLMLDVDHFKRFNDTHGHLAGDECLRQIAQILKSRTMRGSDTAARFGGEEFAVITSADLKDGLALAEIIRSDVESMILPYEPKQVGMVTISIGVSTIIPSDMHDPVDLVALADDALYKAKQAGRNRVVCSSLNE